MTTFTPSREPSPDTSQFTFVQRIQRFVTGVSHTSEPISAVAPFYNPYRDPSYVSTNVAYDPRYGDDISTYRRHQMYGSDDITNAPTNMQRLRRAMLVNSLSLRMQALDERARLADARHRGEHYNVEPVTATRITDTNDTAPITQSGGTAQPHNTLRSQYIVNEPHRTRRTHAQYIQPAIHIVPTTITQPSTIESTTADVATNTTPQQNAQIGSNVHTLTLTTYNTYWHKLQRYIDKCVENPLCMMLLFLLSCGIYAVIVYFSFMNSLQLLPLFDLIILMLAVIVALTSVTINTVRTYYTFLRQHRQPWLASGAAYRIGKILTWCAGLALILEIAFFTMTTSLKLFTGIVTALWFVGKVMSTVCDCIDSTYYRQLQIQLHRQHMRMIRATNARRTAPRGLTQLQIEKVGRHIIWQDDHKCNVDNELIVHDRVHDRLIPITHDDINTIKSQPVCVDINCIGDQVTVNIDMNAEYEFNDTVLSDPNIIDARQASEYDANAPKCAICYVDYVGGDLLLQLECNHAYHVNCLNQWLKRSNTCPFCRQAALNIHSRYDTDDTDTSELSDLHSDDDITLHRHTSSEDAGRNYRQSPQLPITPAPDRILALPSALYDTEHVNNLRRVGIRIDTTQPTDNTTQPPPNRTVSVSSVYDSSYDYSIDEVHTPDTVPIPPSHAIDIPIESHVQA